MDSNADTPVLSPTVLVYDCPSAGTVVHAFNRFAQQRQLDLERKIAAGMARMFPSVVEGERWRRPRLDPSKLPRMTGPPVVESMTECIQLAACDVDEALPTNPLLPADIFSACLTTPIETALRWIFTTRQKQLLPHITMEMIERIPGERFCPRTFPRVYLSQGPPSISP